MQKSLIQPIPPTTDGIPEGLYRNGQHLVVKIDEAWFSYAQKGDAIIFHLYTKKPKKLSKSCDLFINWVFDQYKWCKMLLVTINRRSLINLALKHNFVIVDQIDKSAFLVRKR